MGEGLKLSEATKSGVSQKLNDFEIYLKSERRSPLTIKTYVNIVRRFLKDHGPEDIAESDARAFLANQYEQAGNTARKTYYALRAFFSSMGTPFNVSPPDPTAHPYRPTIPAAIMHKIITVTMLHGSSVERGILALSSIYGVRCKELTNLARADVNFQNQTITIRALKHGRERIHLIPDVIMTYISDYDFKPRSDRTIENIFHRIIAKSGVSLTGKGYGLHSIRRALYTGLTEKGVDLLMRHEFMRWRFRDSMMIDMVYETTPPVEIDKIIFSKHPFLHAWQL